MLIIVKVRLNLKQYTKESSQWEKRNHLITTIYCFNYFMFISNHHSSIVLNIKLKFLLRDLGNE